MEESNFKAPLRKALEEIQKYIDLQLEYNKVLTRKRTGDTVGQLFLMGVMGFLFLFLLLFLSLAFVNWYAVHVGSRTDGFLILSLFYLFLSLVVFAFKQTLIFNPLRKFLTKNFSSKEEQDFFAGKVNHDPQSTKKYIEYLQKQNRKQEQELQHQFREIEKQFNWVNITKNAVTSILQTLSTTTVAIKTAYQLGKKFTSGKKKKALRKRNEDDE